jgi:transposase
MVKVQTTTTEPQPRRQAVKKNTIFVGLDVHKDSIDVAIAEEGRGGEVRHYGTIGGDLASVDKVVRRIRSRGATLRVVYEAGPCGYGIHRHLTAEGIDCVVVAPSMIPKRSGDRVKTDRRDALTLARLHRAGELSAVYVPRPEDEAMRDLVRAREDAKDAERKAKQRLGAFLLRHGVRYAGGKPWSRAHRRWLADRSFAHPAQQIAFQEYVDAVDHCRSRVDRVTEQIQILLPKWRLAPAVEAFQAMRGVSLIVAVTVAAEVGDLSRFDNPRQLMAYLGLVPSEHSSGATVHRGSITKAGNGHARRVLVEGSWTYRFPARVGRRLVDRLEHLPQAIRDIAWKAQVRLCERYRRLHALGKSSQVIVTAIAREMAAFLWAIAREVPFPAA